MCTSYSCSTTICGSPPRRCALQEAGLQARILTPIAVCQVANFLLPVISLAVVGQLGVLELAAATVATTLFNMSAKVGRLGHRRRLLHAQHATDSAHRARMPVATTPVSRP